MDAMLDQHTPDRPSSDPGAAERADLVTTPLGVSVRRVGPAAIGRWLRAGLGDLRAAGWVSVAYGMIFVVAGLAMTVGFVVTGMPYLITPTIGGFLIVGPLLALGLYDISAQVNEGDTRGGGRPRFFHALFAWRANTYHLLTAGLVLMLFMMVWIRLSVVLFALTFPYQSMSLGSLAAQILTVEGITFAVLTTALGFGFAVVAFVGNVVSLPMMLHRRVNFFAAAAVSVLVVKHNRGVMALWAAVIVTVTGLGFVTGFVGLAVTLPLIGHATWHAYRELVVAD